MAPPQHSVIPARLHKIHSSWPNASPLATRPMAVSLQPWAIKRINSSTDTHTFLDTFLLGKGSKGSNRQRFGIHTAKRSKRQTPTQDFKVLHPIGLLLSLLLNTSFFYYSYQLLRWINLINIQENQSAKLTAATLTFQVFITMFQIYLLPSFNFQNSQKQKILIFMFPICVIFTESTTSTLRGKIAYFTIKNCTSLQTQYYSISNHFLPIWD